MSGLAALNDLEVLDLSQNRIRKVEDVAHMTKLERLSLAENQLTSLDAIDEVFKVQSLVNLDLSKNHIESFDGLIEKLQGLPNLCVLYLQGNPGVRTIPNYRKVLLNALPKLSYLDDRPVKDVERVCARAWAEGGREAEARARREFNQQEEERLTGYVKGNRELQERYRLKIQKALARIDRDEAARLLSEEGDLLAAEHVRRLSCASTSSNISAASCTSLLSMD